MANKILWEKESEVSLLTTELQNVADGSTTPDGADYDNATNQFRWADFLFYGPLSNASWAYPAVGVAASLVAYEARLQRRRPKKDSHPLYRLFGQG